MFRNYLKKESYSIVIPVKTGIQNNYNILVPRLRGGDGLKIITWCFRDTTLEHHRRFFGDASEMTMSDYC